ncbi:MAG: heavy metal translocating P-type ATPase [Polyangiaceae bacterium]
MPHARGQVTQSAMPYAGETSSEVACTHCGLPVPKDRQHGEEHSFCCEGCKTVWAVIRDAGLDGYYAHRNEFDADVAPAAVSKESYAAFDAEGSLEQFTRSASDGTHSADVVVENLHCAACVWLVERLDRVVPGVHASEVNLPERRVRVRFDAGAASLGDVMRGLARLGYPPHLAVQSDARVVRTREDRALLTRIGVAGACAGNVMMIAFALYSGADAQWATYFRFAALLLAIPGVFWAGASFFRGAWSALRVRAPHMDLPVSLGLIAGFSSGAINTLRGSGEVYFDSVTAIVFLLLVGRYLERRQHHAAEGAREHVSALFPRFARVIEGAVRRDVLLNTVTRGMQLEVLAGETFPVDGVVTEGESSVDLSPLTGEALPQDIAPGGAVFAGTANCSGPVVLSATAVGSDTRLGRLLEELRHAESRRAPIQRIADRAAGRFVLIVIGVAVLTLLVWAPIDASRGLHSAIALLIVTCPCALGLATPLAMSAAMGRAAHRGYLVRHGEALERLAGKALIVFDKTGTLTTARLRRAEVLGDPDVLPAAAALASQSPHPIARALAADIEIDDRLRVEQRTTVVAQGMAGEVDGVEVCVGRLSFLTARGKRIAEELRESARRQQAQGKTCTFISHGDDVTTAVVFDDTLRPETRDVLARLHAHGHELAIVSGDNTATVQSLAERLGVPFAFVRGDVTPADKARVLQEQGQARPVVMVGDGINDAAALATAGVGIAVHGGAEASLAAADVYVTTPGLATLPGLFTGARRTLRVVKRNLGLSLAYNLVCASLAVTGNISPLLAAVLMPLSSLTVVISSYRARTFDS